MENTSCGKGNGLIDDERTNVKQTIEKEKEKKLDSETGSQPDT